MTLKSYGDSVHSGQVGIRTSFFRPIRSQMQFQWAEFSLDLDLDNDKQDSEASNRKEVAALQAGLRSGAVTGASVQKITRFAAIL